MKANAKKKISKKANDEFVVMPVRDEVAAAAQAIFDRMINARHHDEILHRAYVAFPSSNYADTFARVILLDALYATRLMARSRMAAHIAERGDLRNWKGKKCLVDVIAKLPPPKTKAAPDAEREAVRKKDRTHKSFASKYAHIFVDEERYHILDDASVRMIAWHTGSTLKAAKTWTYEQFNSRAEAVREASNLAPGRSLDRYLWVAGMYYRHRAGGHVNAELVGAFNDRKSRQDLLLIEPVIPPARTRKAKRKGVDRS